MNGFDDKLVTKLQKINDVKLAENPIICDRCHMGALIRVARMVSLDDGRQCGRSREKRELAVLFVLVLGHILLRTSDRLGFIITVQIYGKQMAICF